MRAPPPDESARERLRRLGPNGYIGAVLAANDSVLSRWPEREEPLRVWIQPRPALASFSADFVPPVRAAFRTWSQLGLGVAFVPVADSTDADVHVTWIDAFDTPQQIGSTLRVTDAAGWIVAGNITLALHAGDGSAYDIYTIQNGGLHEVGHLLGLDHSPDHADVMAASTAGRQDHLSIGDENTARLLYMLPPGRVR
jgi:hypothetical protein